MKISIVAHDLVGGGMTRAALLAQAGQSLGHEVEIIGLKSRDEAIYPALPPSLPVRAIEAASRRRRALALLRAIDGDVIYAVKPRPTSFGAGLLARLQRRRPLLLDIDDWEQGLMQHGGAARRRRPLRGLRGWLDPYNKRHILWLDKAAGRADGITVSSRFLEARYNGVYLPNAKDTRVFDPDKFDAGASRKKHGLDQWVNIMFPGTPRPHKGLEDLLAAMRELGRADVRLVLVGGRASSERYVATLLESWGDLIVRLPRIPLHQMPELIAAADVVVVPQRDTQAAQAQCPMKLSDAMAMARPIITTRVGDIPEIVGDSVFLVEPGCPQQLRAALDQILADPIAAEARGRRARQICIERYSVASVSRALGGLLSGFSGSAA